MNPQSSANKVSSMHVIEKINTLIEGNKIYSDEDFNQLIIKIREHKVVKDRSELLTMLTRFSLNTK